MDGIHTTRQTVQNIIEDGRNSKVPDDHYHFIDEAMAMNNDLTTSDLKDILTKRFGTDKVQYGVRTITKVRNDLGWNITTA